MNLIGSKAKLSKTVKLLFSNILRSDKNMELLKVPNVEVYVETNEFGNCINGYENIQTVWKMFFKYTVDDQIIWFLLTCTCY